MKTWVVTYVSLFDNELLMEQVAAGTWFEAVSAHSKFASDSSQKWLRDVWEQAGEDPGQFHALLFDGEILAEALEVTHAEFQPSEEERSRIIAHWEATQAHARGHLRAASRGRRVEEEPPAASGGSPDLAARGPDAGCLRVGPVLPAAEGERGAEVTEVSPAVRSMLPQVQLLLLMGTEWGPFGHREALYALSAGMEPPFAYDSHGDQVASVTEDGAVRCEKVTREGDESYRILLDSGTSIPDVEARVRYAFDRAAQAPDASAEDWMRLLDDAARARVARQARWAKDAPPVPVFREGDALPPMKQYRKIALAAAAQMAEPFQVETREGVMRGAAGDYLMQGAAGELYICAKGIFEATYVVADEDRPRYPSWTAGSA